MGWQEPARAEGEGTLIGTFHSHLPQVVQCMPLLCTYWPPYSTTIDFEARKSSRCNAPAAAYMAPVLRTQMVQYYGYHETRWLARTQRSAALGTQFLGTAPYEWLEPQGKPGWLVHAHVTPRPQVGPHPSTDNKQLWPRLLFRRSISKIPSANIPWYHNMILFDHISGQPMQRCCAQHMAGGRTARSHHQLFQPVRARLELCSLAYATQHDTIQHSIAQHNTARRGIA